MFAAGDSPSGLVVGDFDGNGKDDLLTTDADADTISVLLGRGDGSFGLPESFAVGSNPVAAAVGDFDRNGKRDVVVANRDSANVSVLLGRGDGSFDAARQFPTGTSPLSVAVADMNRDGIEDLAVANLDSDSVSILLGGAMAASVPGLTSSPAGRRRRWRWATSTRTAGPTSWWPTTSGPTSRSSWGRTGGFGASTTYWAWDYAMAVAIGDFDRDGHQDIVATNYFTGISVLFGNGDGTFDAARRYTWDDPPSVALADFDRDGSTDIAVANFYRGTVSVLLGNTDGTFATPVLYPVGSYPATVAAGDFDSNGIADLAVTNSESATVSVLLGTGDGTFPVTPAIGVQTAPVGAHGRRPGRQLHRGPAGRQRGLRQRQHPERAGQRRCSPSRPTTRPVPTRPR